MKNGNLSQFLDTRWYMGTAIFYHEYVYWCEGVTSFETDKTTFGVERWKAHCDGELYNQLVKASGDLVDYEKVFEITGTDMDEIKRQFLTASIFESKSFWDVENDLIWVDEGIDIQI